MVKVTVCIGSCCHTKGAGRIVERLQRLIAEAGLKDRVDLAGKFCMGTCEKGVCVTVDGAPFSLTPETVREFFEREVKARAV